jgi:hypothetical protein
LVEVAVSYGAPRSLAIDSTSRLLREHPELDAELVRTRAEWLASSTNGGQTVDSGSTEPVEEIRERSDPIEMDPSSNPAIARDLASLRQIPSV